ncbi:MAG: large conductance mechanosensitive channel protein MscL [Oscillospiraceae bacterium]|jgi:large conductance mechanosensitive channel|nr:large conductance mechanosensitive channel protein MscL [Oscillospiraceae bacterium]
MKKKIRVEKIGGVLGEFKAFILRGNVIDLAVGVIIGGAFQKIITALVEDIFMPLILFATRGHLDMDGLVFSIAPGITLRYGDFLSTVLDFLFMAAVVFLLVKAINTIAMLRKKENAVYPDLKPCPYCRKSVSVNATRCPFCTSHLSDDE